MKKIIKLNNNYIFPDKLWLHFYDEDGFYSSVLVSNSNELTKMITKEFNKAILLKISTSSTLQSALYEGDLNIEKSIDSIVKYYGVDSDFKLNLIDILYKYKNLIDDKKEIDNVNKVIKDAEKILK